MNVKKKILLFILPLILFFLGVRAIVAQTDSEKLNLLNQQISEYQAQITKLKTQANTLSNQIAQFNAQISLTTLKITQTEEQIELLGGRIDQLEGSLSALSSAFSSRAIETYKMSRAGESVFLVLSSNNIGDAVSRFHYLQKIQEADRNLLIRLQTAQNTYKVEKGRQEELAKLLDDQKKALVSQKAAKAQLLSTTKNDEAKYQSLLAKARAELDAIQSIIAGKGQETPSGPISEGQRIASIIAGSSACSSGGHLHFEVVQGGAHQNPANFLSPKSIIWNNEPDGAFGFSGSWQWPVNDPIRITQGYGMTYYAATLKYYGGAPHTGIDMVSASGDMNVKAVRNGTLYRGAIACGGGTLRYVKVQQSDGYDTYYLHINY